MYIIWGGRDDVDPLLLVLLSLSCKGNALRVRRGSFTIWSNRKTPKPETLKH